MDIIKELAEREKEREIDKKEFKKDSKKAYFEFIKEVNPKNWWLSNISSWIRYPPFIFGWKFYLKNSPIWGCYDHWIYKKWEIKPTRFVHEYVVRRIGSKYEGFDI